MPKRPPPINELALIAIGDDYSLQEYIEKIEVMTTNDILAYIAITGIFLSGFIPIVMGIIYYTRENRRLDKEEKEAKKAAARQ